MTHLLNAGRSPRYKGNVHLHTTNSDGRLSPADAAAWYRQRGYHFVAITDHNKLTDVDELSDDGFLVIAACELDVDNTELGQTYHFLALGLHTPVAHAERRAVAAQSVVDELNRLGAAVVLAHPYWSGLTVAEMLPLQGITGVEVYNTSAERDLGKGLSASQWDDVLARGRCWWGLGVDDTHWVDDDAGEGWVVVEAKSLTEASILAALREGRFYASTGPDIYSLVRDGSTLTVTCSPVKTINFIGQTQWGAQRRSTTDGLLTEAGYQMRGCETYVRVECVDERGRRAWSNPVYL